MSTQHRRKLLCAVAVATGFVLWAPDQAAGQQWDGRSVIPGVTAERLNGARGQFSPFERDGATFNLMAANVMETEPNDSLRFADSVVIGDIIDGVIGTPVDFDYFQLDLNAGDILDADIDAFVLGSALDPVIALFRVDTTAGAVQPIDTVLVALSDDGDQLDSRIIWDVEKNGTYFVGIRDVQFGGSTNHTYTIALRPQTRQEIEPNNAAATAQVIAIGDSSLGFVNPDSDADYYAVDLNPGSSIQVSTDAQDIGSVLFTLLNLYASDGTTLLNSASGAADVSLRYFAPTGGRFYLEVTDRESLGGPAFFYTVRIDTIPVGPGDPTTLFATGLGQPGGVVAGAVGELFVVDLLADQLLRVDPDGSVSVVVQLGGLTDVSIDGFGDLLVTGFQLQGLIWRVNPDGSTSVFSDKPQFPGAITVGPDGDIWSSDPAAEMIWRFDPRGNLKDSVIGPTTGLPIFDMAFSPSGVLHATNRANLVMKVENGELVAAFQTDVTAEGLAFDRDGFLYLANGFERRVALFDATYQAVERDFMITNLGGPITLAFGRAADGAMTSRLFAVNNSFGILPPFAGGMVEANPSGIRAPGFRVGIDLLLISDVPLDSGAVGAEYADTLAVEGFSGTPTWSIIDGNLPSGLVLDAATGAISGVPDEAGSFPFTARAVSGNRFGDGDMLIVVDEPVVALNDVVDELLGVTGLLSDAVKNFVDIKGNRNGMLDVGDLRAFLREGAAPVSPALQPGRQER